MFSACGGDITKKDYKEMSAEDSTKLSTTLTEYKDAPVIKDQYSVKMYYNVDVEQIIVGSGMKGTVSMNTTLNYKKTDAKTEYSETIEGSGKVTTTVGDKETVTNLSIKASLFCVDATDNTQDAFYVSYDYSMTGGEKDAVNVSKKIKLSAAGLAKIADFINDNFDNSIAGEFEIESMAEELLTTIGEAGIKVLKSGDSYKVIIEEPKDGSTDYSYLFFTLNKGFVTEVVVQAGSANNKAEIGAKISAKAGSMSVPSDASSYTEADDFSIPSIFDD